jgi:hypothetical protein
MDAMAALIDRQYGRAKYITRRRVLLLFFMSGLNFTRIDPPVKEPHPWNKARGRRYIPVTAMGTDSREVNC